MKKKILLAILAVGLVGAGCVDTVSGRKTAGVPFIKDAVEGRYERPPAQVFQAAIEVVKLEGTLVNESTLYTQTNTVKTIEGKINQRNVWIRVQALDPKITSIVVQTRTPGGGSDIDLAHDVEKKVAIKLVSR